MLLYPLALVKVKFGVWFCASLHASWLHLHATARLKNPFTARRPCLTLVTLTQALESQILCSFYKVHCITFCVFLRALHQPENKLKEKKKVTEEKRQT